MSAIPPIQVSKWMQCAQDAKIVLHRDALLSPCNGSIPVENEILKPRFTPDFVQEIGRKIEGGCHFTYFTPNEVLLKVFDKSCKSLEEVATTTRALELTLGDDLSRYFLDNNPAFLDVDSNSRLRISLKIFEPKNPIDPHRDRRGAKMLSVVSCTDVLDVKDDEHYADTTLWNLNPEYGTEPTDNDFNYIRSHGVHYIMTRFLERADIEKVTLPTVPVNDFRILIYTDWLLAHSTSKQISKSDRTVNIVDITSEDVEHSDFADPDYLADYIKAQRDFIAGVDCEFY